MNPFDLSVRFFVQVALILTVWRLTRALFRRLGQSQVVGEMVAGVLMGPSFFAWLAPFCLGGALTSQIAADPALFGARVSPSLAALCMGVSITRFGLVDSWRL